MSSSGTPVTLRRGLPRTPGSEAWPIVEQPIEVDESNVMFRIPASAPGTIVTPAPPAEVVAPVQPVAEPVPATDASTEAPEATTETAAPPAAVAVAEPVTVTEQVTLRRGLPRVAGEESWPAVDTASVRASTTSPAVAPAASELPVPAAAQTPEAAHTPETATNVAPTEATARTVPQEQSLRQGLPRVVGEAHWPLTATAQVQQRVPAEEPVVAAEPVIEQPAVATAPVASAAPAAPAVPASPAPAAPTASQPAAAKPAAAKPAAAKPAATKPVEKRPSLLAHPWAKFVLLGIGLIVVAAIAVLASRMFLGSQAGQGFLGNYPGEYHLPESAPEGFPAWLGWQHFLNVFLMVLIIRSGIQIRGETRPAAFWTPRGRTDGKVSLTIWFHQSVDLLWLINGALFMVLLFATGQWMRVIPTSLEVFPNAISAALQYMSLDWPTDNGWVNYNSLQQLAYFATIFIAAPLAAVTGFRMSAMWPKKAKKLSAIYPMELARKLHFPVMLYFVAFILIHVLLVLSTGALRNLNHMYAAQGSADPTEFANNWFGFWMFVVSLVVIVGAAFAARPFILAPIASAFGKVSSR